MPYFHSFLSTDLITPIKVEKCSLLAAALSLDHQLNVINKPIPFFLVLFEFLLSFGICCPLLSAAISLTISNSWSLGSSRIQISQPNM